MDAVRLFVKVFVLPFAIAVGAAAGAWFVSGSLASLLGAVAVWHALKLWLRIVMHRKVAAAILANYPEKLEPKAAPGPAPEELADLELQILALGFANATPLLEMPMSPPALMRGFYLPGRDVYATAFLAGGRELGFDFVSVVEGTRGGLTTSPNPKSASVPTAPGSLRQVFPGLEPAALLAKHLEAVDALEAKGLRFERATAAGLVPAFQVSMARSRAAFLKNRFTWTQIALGRVQSNTYPDQGPVAERSDARGEIERLAKAA